ncbi:hypothetical protein MKZ25_10135 [Solibacillus sp. FSL W7-1464]|uniref:hypothetical protein n=1 Tax=Solibacillus sp. FSL W7-1464 TaxID=2921706 RepID=UPI0030F9D2ED
MFIQINEEEIEFTEVEISVLEQGIADLFERFDKRTLGELTEQKKYEHLKDLINEHSHLVDMPAGAALKVLKNEGNYLYRQFLNNYGDLVYSRFVVSGDEELLKQRGVYTVIANNELKFCGVCARTFKERFNQHIGNIYAKGCYRDGTSTHCHVNAKITQLLPASDVHFAIYPMENEKAMNKLKNAIVKRFEPEWNIRSNREVFELTSSL